MMTTRYAYSVRTLAERWCCSEGLVRKLIHNGELRRIEGFSLMRISADEVDRYEGTPLAENVAPEEVPAVPQHTTPRADPEPLPSVALSVYQSKIPDWPQAMKRKTAAAYCDISIPSFLKEIARGNLPVGFTLGGTEHWHRAALDSALSQLVGEATSTADDDEIMRELREHYGT